MSGVVFGKFDVDGEEPSITLSGNGSKEDLPLEPERLGEFDLSDFGEGGLEAEYFEFLVIDVEGVVGLAFLLELGVLGLLGEEAFEGFV